MPHRTLRLATCLSVLTALIPAAFARSPEASYVTEQPTRAPHAMVVSVHHLAADAGVEIMREGGNAIDAAVATGFALAVVHPVAGNIGGGGFMLIRMHNGKATFLDYRERAPLAATPDMYLDAKGEVIPDLSVVGYKAVAVPGSVAGMVYAEKKYGRLDLKRVMRPALDLAIHGFVLSTEEAEELHDSSLALFPESKRIFQRDGRYYQPGEFLRQPDLARTLERIAENPDSFYRGDLAREIARAIRKGGGLVTEADLAGYEVKEREPVTGTYKDFTIISAPPPSSGGIVLIEALNILEGYNLSRLGDRTPAEMHLIAESYRRAYMDRADYLGDPDFSTIPVEKMLDKRYAAAWRNSIRADHATPSAGLHRPVGFLPDPPRPQLRPTDHVNTTHYSVVDSEGNAVSVTTTLNNSFGSAATAEGLGFLLNDEMDDFAAKQGVPNLYGLVQGPANAIAPRKRPLSSMTPTIVLREGKLSMVLGSPGGGRIPTTVANILLSVADEDLNIQQAVDAPRFHHQYLPDTLFLEPGFPSATTAGLTALGYKLDSSERWSDGECISVDRLTGELEGGQDHRHHFGKASGY